MGSVFKNVPRPWWQLMKFGNVSRFVIIRVQIALGRQPVNAIFALSQGSSCKALMFQVCVHAIVDISLKAWI